MFFLHFNFERKLFSTNCFSKSGRNRILLVTRKMSLNVYYPFSYIYSISHFLLKLERYWYKNIYNSYSLSFDFSPFLSLSHPNANAELKLKPRQAQTDAQKYVFKHLFNPG